MTKENIASFKEELDEFHQLYADRPIANNEGGMKSPHLFATFHTLRKLRPLLIIESGVWKGQGTWLMKKALPEVNILSFDVDFFRNKYYTLRKFSPGRLIMLRFNIKRIYNKYQWNF